MRCENGDYVDKKERKVHIAKRSGLNHNVWSENLKLNTRSKRLYTLAVYEVEEFHCAHKRGVKWTHAPTPNYRKISENHILH